MKRGLSEIQDAEDIQCDLIEERLAVSFFQQPQSHKVKKKEEPQKRESSTRKAVPATRPVAVIRPLTPVESPALRYLLSFHLSLLSLLLPKPSSCLMHLRLFLGVAVSAVPSQSCSLASSFSPLSLSYPLTLSFFLR